MLEHPRNVVALAPSPRPAGPLTSLAAQPAPSADLAGPSDGVDADLGQNPATLAAHGLGVARAAFDAEEPGTPGTQ